MFSFRKLSPSYLIVRFYKTNSVRVRFAPSPTGYLHLGGLRTALYNYLYAKSKNGKFILRIEDTDQTRLVHGAAQQLKDDLMWAGIEIDEGPNIGGSVGPYIQSDRLQIYKEQIKTLLDNETAYPCFCTEKRLDLLRRQAVKNQEVPKYDNKCRHLSKEQISEKWKEGAQPCIRFKLSSDITCFEDLIYGKISYNVSQQEGDPVIMKADGYPTYHFANIVDDHFMEISHVLRGVEWQISTTKHLLLYRAFGWNPPKFGHLPLLLNSDGTKFSKRQNDIKISHYRDSGIFPLALLNFVLDAGGGFQKDLEQNVKPRFYTIDDLSSQFNLAQLKTHSGRLMPEKLLEFNQLELRRLLQNKSGESDLIKSVQNMLQRHFDNSTNDASLQMDEEHIRSVLHWCADRIKKLSDLVSHDLSFVWTMPKYYNLKKNELIFLDDLTVLLENQNEFSKNDLSKFLRSFAEQRNVKFNELMMALRSVLSGLKQGPGVAEMMEILGKDTTIHRLKMCLNNSSR
ncbi:hypothetical protein HHI36_006046 [Cryptolaemus montrouzieri]|uniref:Nondiscriminating glutamyl-tRNA synthetase EARS2, mitochondrial n=1 Tax=Cryptolaemus montrouzieri TaxID=559131 RepID=A0ABD2NW28_9CUCU